jgi:hypothetical protein
MKLTKIILGCALATGLMTFASNTTQAASIVIDNVLYSEVNIKATIEYSDGTKISKASESSKDILKELGYNNDVVLAMAGSTENIWVVNKKTGALISNLTASNILYFDYEDYASSTSSDGDKYEELGNLFLTYNGASEFYIYGSYDYKATQGSKADKDGLTKVSNGYNAKQLTGQGDSADLEVSGLVTGSFSSKGSGKLNLAL